MHLSVILFTGGVSPIACWDIQSPRQTPLWADIPPGQTPPPQADTPWVLWDTVNKRAVRILLECILVFSIHS